MPATHEGYRGRLRRWIAERLILFVAEDPRMRVVTQNSGFRRSLRNALKGLAFAALSQRNFRFELLAFGAAIMLAAILRISLMEWALLSHSCFLVLALEAKNTALESSVDLSTTEYHYGAKGSKDAASGAVLLSAVNSLVVGLLIFGPRLARIGRVLLALAGVGSP